MREPPSLLPNYATFLLCRRYRQTNLRILSVPERAQGGPPRNERYKRVRSSVLCSSVLCVAGVQARRNEVHHGRVGKGRGIAEIAVLRNVAQQAAHDFA